MSLIQQAHSIEEPLASSQMQTACDEFQSMVELIRAAEGLGARLQWLKERAAHHLNECGECQGKVKRHLRRDSVAH